MKSQRYALRTEKVRKEKTGTQNPELITDDMKHFVWLSLP